MNKKIEILAKLFELLPLNHMEEAVSLTHINCRISIFTINIYNTFGLYYSNTS